MTKTRISILLALLVAAGVGLWTYKSTADALPPASSLKAEHNRSVVRLKVLPPYLKALALLGVGSECTGNVPTCLKRANEGPMAEQLAALLVPRKLQGSFRATIARWILRRRLREQLSGRELAELYLSRAYFGARTYGLTRASVTFVGRAPDDITVKDASLLLAALQDPDTAGFCSDTAALAKRQGEILDEAIRREWIPSKLAKEAKVTTAPKAEMCP